MQINYGIIIKGKTILIAKQLLGGFCLIGFCFCCFRRQWEPDITYV